MDATITLGDLGLIIIAIALIILICYCIFLVKNLIPAAKTLNRILEDTARITGAAADGAEGAKKMIDDMSESVSVVSDALKGNEGFFRGLTSLFKAITSLIGLLNNKKID
ncbi:MAG: hypothetical protein ACOX4J_10050 [Anaerovoracaceae bacterium]